MTLENAPALEIDKILYNDRGTTMSPRNRRERRVVWNLFKHMLNFGWSVVKVYDGDEYNKVLSAKAAMEIIFNLDEAQVVFMHADSAKTHYVMLVLGNDIDVVSDWTYIQGDPDGFNAAMDKFDAEVYA